MAGILGHTRDRRWKEPPRVRHKTAAAGRSALGRECDGLPIWRGESGRRPKPSKRVAENAELCVYLATKSNDDSFTIAAHGLCHPPPHLLCRRT
jgi:hypothetical protein